MLFLIDLDGTLVDTDDLHHEAWATVLKTTPERIKKIPDIHLFLDGIYDAEYLRMCKKREMLKTKNITCIKSFELDLSKKARVGP